MYEAIKNFPTDIMFDTMGFGWIYPIAKLLCPDVKVVSYSHYPFISSDMINKVENRTVDFNNEANISGSKWKSMAKGLYYRFIVMLYRFVGRSADLIMTNSSWTYNHFADLWSSKRDSLCKLYCRFSLP